jgi:hypothetical protein
LKDLLKLLLAVMIISVDDQISEKCIALVIKGSKLTCTVLAKAMLLSLKQITKPKQKTTEPIHGKQSVKQLTRQGVGVSSITITDKNIKAFEGIARKYGVDFAVKKDKTVIPPNWLVFFKGRDADVITAAFKEFSAKQLSKTSKPSIIKSMHDLMAEVKAQVVSRTKNMHRGRDSI